MTERFRGDEIPYSQYEEEKKNIVVPGELELDELFVLMMAVKNSKNTRLAYRLISHVVDVDVVSRLKPYYRVDFRIYGSDMEQKAELRDRFDLRGYWQPHWSLRRDIAGAHKRIQSGYFSDSDIITEEPNFEPVILADMPSG